MHRPAGRGALALASAALLALLPSLDQPATAATEPSDFLAGDGSVLRTNHGTGEVVNLRGTNLGGWLTFEDWMSPLGEFALDRTGWAATASGGSAAALIDGSGASRWTTGATQAGGEWFQLDLGSPTLLNRIQLETGAFGADAPARYDVAVSADGQSWTSVAAGSGSVATPTTIVRFTPQVARHVRVSQSGTSGQWWSVTEVNLFSDPVLHSGTHSASASSSAAGNPPALALDGNPATRWTSGAPQAAGQAFVLDLGRNTEVGRVLVDAGAEAPTDYPRAWSVWTSGDGTSWEKQASGFGSERLLLAEFWTTEWARFIKVEQGGEDASWWSIGEVAVYSGQVHERSGWTVSSPVGADASAALDGRLDTRWTTGTAQVPGQSFTVDFGATLTLNNVTLDVQKNSPTNVPPDQRVADWEQDYPRGFDVQLSADGTTWRTVARGAGTWKATTIGFPATSGRYLRLVQTGAASQWWSIGELTTGLNSDDFSLRSTLDQRFGRAQAQEVVDVHRDTWIQEADLDRLAATGINTVRLPIGWNELLHLDGTWKSDPWSKIDWLVAEAAERDIYVLLDLHTVPGGGCPWGSCGRIGPNPNGFWTNPTYQDWVVEIWEAIAARYEGNPTVAGYDLINEPLVDYGEDVDDVALKSAVYDRIYDAVRAVDPDHLIVLAAFFGWAAIDKPAVHGWDNVMYELHPYDMGNGPDWNAQNALVQQQLADASAKIADPEWDVPILYGEYSLYHYDDVWSTFMAGLNARDISWTNWTYKVRGDHASGGGGYWGLYNTNLHPVPVINSDDAATFRDKLDEFGTENFRPNERFLAITTEFAGGDDDYSPPLLERTGWSVTASSTEPGGSAARAIDGSAGTRWSSGASQTPGQWFRIDLGAVRSVQQVTVQTGPDDRWDHLRGFRLEVSDDGSAWRTVASGPGFGWKRPMAFAPTQARYLRIVQTGTAPEWWSIAEVDVWGADT